MPEDDLEELSDEEQVASSDGGVYPMFGGLFMTPLCCGLRSPKNDEANPRSLELVLDSFDTTTAPPAPLPPNVQPCPSPVPSAAVIVGRNPAEAQVAQAGAASADGGGAFRTLLGPSSSAQAEVLAR
jgi:hypothetical protein